MRKLSRFLLIGAFVLGVAAPSSAVVLPFNSTLKILVATLPAASFTGSGFASVNSGTGAFTLPANHINAGTFTAPVSLFTGVPLISSLRVRIDGNAAGSFVPSFVPVNGHPTYTIFPNAGGSAMTTKGVNLQGGGVNFGGNQGILGAAFANVLLNFDVPVPLSNGGVGTTTNVTGGNLMVQIVGTQFTTGMGTVQGVTTTITIHSPFTSLFYKDILVNVNNTALAGQKGTTDLVNAGDLRTAGHQGLITLLSPAKAVTNAAGNLPVFALLQVDFTPEPGTLLLLGSGVVGLGLLGRRRMRK